jgi:hypothetical protein
MKRQEDELRQAELDQIREEKEKDRMEVIATEEKRRYRIQIEKLEEELRKAKEAAGNVEKENESSEGENGRHQKRGR